ncbi:MAG: non-heme iron oxygenase ferredoxin subunit [Gammaproteobacteria bacterium]|nr:non-heme iron oxygenase ferredoxin subunit [Gammaproteobacteria bacterium]
MSDGYIKVGEIDAVLPGKMKCVNVNGRRILLANVDGRFYATDDTCTHEDASLSTGFLKGELVKCPLHGSRFNVCTGAVLDEPAEINLKTYPVRLEGKNIMIALTASKI